MEDYLLLVVGLVAVALIIFALLKLGGKVIESRNLFVFIGLPGSGKTYTFAQLVHNACVETAMSMKPNEGSITLTSEKGKEITAKLVDVPGHERLRSNVLREMSSKVRGIVVFVDSAKFGGSDVRDVAAVLYDVFTSKQLRSAPLLVLCNKQDQFLPIKPEAVEQALAKELNTIRSTRGADLEGTDGSDPNQALVPLAPEGEDFKFGMVHANFFPFTAKPEAGAEAQLSKDLPIIRDWIAGILG